MFVEQIYQSCICSTVHSRHSKHLQRPHHICFLQIPLSRDLHQDLCTLIWYKVESLKHYLTHTWLQVETHIRKGRELRAVVFQGRVQGSVNLSSRLHTVLWSLCRAQHLLLRTLGCAALAGLCCTRGKGWDALAMGESGQDSKSFHALPYPSQCKESRLFTTENVLQLCQLAILPGCYSVETIIIS